VVEKDVVQLSGSSRLLHVCVFADPEIGPARPGLAGIPCPYCGTAVDEETRVYHCGCGKPIHMEIEGPDNQEALQCAQLSPQCGSCGSPIFLVHGYRHLPRPFDSSMRPPPRTEAASSAGAGADR
jgi:hypothetical protein